MCRPKKKYKEQLAKSYLQDRPQSIVVDAKLSGNRMKDCDVLQGSVLGPDLHSNFTHLFMLTKCIYLNPNSNVGVKEAVSKMELCCVKLDV